MDTHGREDVVMEAEGAVPSAASARRLASAQRLTRHLGTALGIGEAASPPHVLRREGLYRRSLAVADLWAAALALAIVIPFGGDRMEPLILLALPLVVVVSKVIGLYDRDELVISKTTLEEAPALFQVATLYALLLSLLANELTGGNMHNYQVVELWILLFLLFLIGRTVARRLVRVFAPPERCLLVGDRATHARLAAKLAANRSTKAELVGHIDHLDAPGRVTAGNGHGALSDTETLVSDLRLHRLIVAPGSTESDRVLEFIATAKGLGVRVSVLPRLFDVVGSSVEFDRLDGLTLLGVRRFGLTRSSRALKRGLDVVVSAVGLIALAPLLVLIAMIIKIESRGPALFRQTRVGREDRTFSMLKFRSMIDGADARKSELHALNEADGLFKIALDPRVTRFGRWLRSFSLDELPQLWNVLRGEMILVGPRPLVCVEDERVEGWHRRRLKLTPGMTGQWQILGSARIPLHEMVAIDYLYAANWSLWLDVQLLLRTIPYVLSRGGV
jgi:exopolysaccharide biosynthesis polyprenyl glycosylphosphotransferase